MLLLLKRRVMGMRVVSNSKSITNKEYPYVVIIMVSYNARKDVVACLDSLRALQYPKEKYRIIVVDNNSRDDTVSFLRMYYPDIQLIANHKNEGFGRANNRAFSSLFSFSSTSSTSSLAHEAKYVLLINQDSLVDKHLLRELVAVMETHPGAGVCGTTEKPYVEYRKEEYVRQSQPRNKQGIKECTWMGCGCVMFRRAALEQVDFFDKFYFMYAEDIDVTWRLRIAGWKVLQSYNALWFHRGKNRSLTYDDKRLYWAWKNRIYLLIKFASVRQIQRSITYYLQQFFNSRGISEHAQSWQGRAKRIGQSSITGGPLPTLMLKRKIQKLTLLIKLALSLLYTVPYALKERWKLARKYNVNRKDVDAWVQHMDKIAYTAEDEQQ